MDAFIKIADRFGVGTAVILFVAWIVWQEVKDVKKRKNFKGTESLLKTLKIELAAFKDELESSVCRVDSDDKKTWQTSRCNFTNERERHLSDIRDYVKQQVEVSKQILFYLKGLTFGMKKMNDENGD